MFNTFKKIGNKISNLKRRAKHKININGIKDKDSAFEAISTYGIKLYSAIDELGIPENCTELSEENKGKLFKLFKTGGGLRPAYIKKSFTDYKK